MDKKSTSELIHAHIKTELETVYKSLFNTYLVIRYIDFKQLPSDINKHILSFITYGKSLCEFIENYHPSLSYNGFEQTKTENIYKKRFAYIYDTYEDDIINESFINSVIRIAIIRNIECIRKYVRITFRHIPILELVKLPTNYFYDENEPWNITTDEIVRVEYNTIICKSMMRAIKSYNYNLLKYMVKINTKYINNNLLEYCFCRLYDCWQIISLLHMNNKYKIDDFMEILCIEKNTTIIKYLVKNKLYKIRSDVEFISMMLRYNIPEILDDIYDDMDKRLSAHYDVKQFLVESLISSSYKSFMWICNRIDMSDHLIRNVIRCLSYDDDALRETLFGENILIMMYGQNSQFQQHAFPDYDMTFEWELLKYGFEEEEEMTHIYDNYGRYFDSF